MKLDETTAAFLEQVDDLARGNASREDWCRIETRLRKAMLHAEHEHRDELLIDALRLLRLCVQSQIFELEQTERQHAHGVE